MEMTFLAYPLVQGALSGLVAAAAIDYQAFRSWKSVSDAKQYAWGLALWRWFQGVVSGIVTAAGLGALSA